MKLLVVDDHSIVRKGLVGLIGSTFPDFIIRQANDGNEALAKIEEEMPDIMITDITMPDLSGLELVKKVRETNSSIKILIFSMHLEEAYINDAIEFGVNGYIVKGEENENEILDAIREVIKHQKYFSSLVSKVLINKMIDSKKEVKLTDKETEIVKHISEGLLYKEIADIMNISIRTVDSHRKNILVKLDITTNADLIKYAIKNRIIKL